MTPQPSELGRTNIHSNPIFPDRKASWVRGLYVDFLLLQAILLTACSSPLISQRQINDSTSPAPSTASLGLTEVCTGPLVEETRATSEPDVTPIPIVYFEGSVEAIKQIPLHEENIITLLKKPEDSYKAILIPIGFEDKAQLESYMWELTIIMNKAFLGLPVEFSYLNQSAPVTFSRTSHDLAGGNILDETERVAFMERLQKLRQFHDVLFVVNSTEDFGGRSYDGYAITSVDPIYGYFSALHEFSHPIFTERYIQAKNARYFIGISSTEIFTDVNVLKPGIKEVAERIGAPVVPTAYSCYGDQIYRFYPDDDVMSRAYTNQEVESVLSTGRSLFNPLQWELLKLNYERVINQQP